MRQSERVRLWQCITGELRRACKRQNIHLDTYDADFIIGVIMEQLGDDLVLTGSGLKRLRRK